MLFFITITLWALCGEIAGTEPRKLLSIALAARRLGIGRSKLYELIAAGKIPTVAIGTMRRRVGGTVAARRLVPIEAIDAYADSVARETGINREGRELRAEA